MVGDPKINSRTNDRAYLSSAEQVGRRESTFDYHNFARKNNQGAGMFFKFTHIENRLIRWLFERHGFKESLMDY